MQQALAADDVLHKFLKNDEKIKRVKEIFTGLYSLDLVSFFFQIDYKIFKMTTSECCYSSFHKNAAGDEAIEMVLENPDDFVLKPQREGGGNNVYGQDIPKVINQEKYFFFFRFIHVFLSCHNLIF